MSKKTEQIKFMQAMFPNVKFVECKYIEEGQRVADTSKTIDHIADVSNMVSLTEQWKKGELDGAYYIKNGNGEYEVEIFQDKRKDYRFIGSPISEFICKVPSYEEWQPFTDPYFRGLTTKDISELAKKSIRLTTQHLKDCERIEKLEELLKECREYVVNTPVYPQGDEEKQKEIHRLVDKINEVLK